jgi:hypothetical protein
VRRARLALDSSLARNALVSTADLERVIGSWSGPCARFAVVTPPRPSPRASGSPAPGAAPVVVQLITWRHGYRTGLSQARALLRRLKARQRAGPATVEDAIRTLQGWLDDPA